MPMPVLGQAQAQLLQVEDTRSLIHPVLRALDRRQQGKQAGNEDTGGDGGVRPAERDGHRHEVEDAPPPAILGDKGQGAARQIGRNLDHQAVVEQLVERPGETVEGFGLMGISGELTLDLRTAGAVELAESEVEHILRVHRINHSHHDLPPWPSA